MNPLAWLNPGRWLLYGAFIAALIFGVWLLEKHIESLGYAKAQTEYAAQAKSTDTKRAAITPAIEIKAAEVAAKIITVTKTLIKEVPIYVKDTDCALSGGFRVFHDAAANGVVPNPADVADAAGVTAQDVAVTVADNYGTCQQTAARLSGLQDWVRAQAVVK